MDTLVSLAKQTVVEYLDMPMTLYSVWKTLPQTNDIMRRKLFDANTPNIDIYDTKSAPSLITIISGTNDQSSQIVVNNASLGIGSSNLVCAQLKKYQQCEV